MSAPTPASPNGVDLDPTATRLATIRYGNDGPHLAVVEIATGSVLDFDGVISLGDGSSWTVDGQHLVWAGDGAVNVFTVGADAPVRYKITRPRRAVELRAVAVALTTPAT